jgi:predicted HTH transcriptional regulator
MVDVAVRGTAEHGGLVFENRDIRAMAKVEFGEDVAALANTSGGVLVVGVSDKTRLRTD